MSAQTFGNPIKVLLVDDDLQDIELMEDRLHKSKLKVALGKVTRGEDAIKYLRREPPFEKADRPDLVLLDLNMPKMSGREVLEKIKQDPNLRTIPVVILTTSEAEEDVLRSYETGANCYVTKPVGLDEFRKIVGLIEEFWMTVVKLPPRGGARGDEGL